MFTLKNRNRSSDVTSCMLFGVRFAIGRRVFIDGGCPIKRVCAFRSCREPAVDGW